MYKLTYRKDVHKSLKKIKKSNSKKFVQEFLEIFNEIANDPEKAGEPYVGNMKGLYKYSYGNSPQYRIMYAFYSMRYVKKNIESFEDLELTEEDYKNFDGIVDLIFLRTREECNNLYKQKRSYFEEKLRIGEEVEAEEE